MPWGYTFLRVQEPHNSSHTAVQTYVYISEYTDLTLFWHRFGTVWSRIGTVWSLIGTVWSRILYI